MFFVWDVCGEEVGFVVGFVQCRYELACFFRMVKSFYLDCIITLFGFFCARVGFGFHFVLSFVLVFGFVCCRSFDWFDGGRFRFLIVVLVVHCVRW